jgi:hypothetical protein
VTDNIEAAGERVNARMIVRLVNREKSWCHWTAVPMALFGHEVLFWGTSTVAFVS